MTRKRAVGYLRVSTLGQQRDGLGLEVQRESVTAYAAEKRLELIEVVEEAASGGVRDGEEFSYEHRPALLSLMARAGTGAFDILLVAKLDRLSRDYATLIVLERRLERSGVEVVSAAEENGDGPVAELLRGQLALIAQFERAQIRERLSGGKAVKRSRGGNTDGRIPYGYRSADGRLVIDEDAARVVRRLYSDARNGYSPGRIARGLNRDGIRSPWGRAWSQTTVRRILANPVYVGERQGIRNAHPAIVSRRAWNAAQAALAARARGAG